MLVKRMLNIMVCVTISFDYTNIALDLIMEVLFFGKRMFLHSAATKLN